MFSVSRQQQGKESSQSFLSEAVKREFSSSVELDIPALRELLPKYTEKERWIVVHEREESFLGEGVSGVDIDAFVPYHVTIVYTFPYWAGWVRKRPACASLLLWTPVDIRCSVSIPDQSETGQNVL